MSVSPNDLRSISLFAQFDDAELALVCDLTIAREYAPRAIVFLQGEPSPGLWFVRRGRVRLYRVAPSGREFTLCVARAGVLPCMGACPLFDGAPTPANAQALEPATVYFIDRQRALATAADHAGMARVLARVLANHARHLTRLTAGLALRCSAPRLSELLLTYADECGRVTARGIELELDLSHQLLASVLGATPQMLAQDFLKLERAGVVDAQGRHIVILDVARLKTMI